MNTNKKYKYAIFLGAGASASDGAPIQSKLFAEYFKQLKTKNPIKITKYETEIISFFKNVFGIDYLTADLDKVKFPTFEEALGILDLANARSESFKGIPNIDIDTDSGKIIFLRLYLVFLLADVLTRKLYNSNGYHRELIHNLNNIKKLDDILFITTNYDILCDNALLETAGNVNYGIEFKENYFNKNYNFTPPLLLKLHGSLNWLYCSTCNTIELTPYEKGVYNLISNPERSHCDDCGSIYSPIIIPPTFYKDFKNIYLNIVWNKAELLLSQVDHIIFCGYSFPDADIHIKYLIKRIQINRQNESLKFSIINNFTGKTNDSRLEEKNRFIRFLGRKVNYTSYSFEEFAENPSLIIKDGHSLTFDVKTENEMATPENRFILYEIINHFLKKKTRNIRSKQTVSLELKLHRFFIDDELNNRIPQNIENISHGLVKKENVRVIQNYVP